LLFGDRGIGKVYRTAARIARAARSAQDSVAVDVLPSAFGAEFGCRSIAFRLAICTPSRVKRLAIVCGFWIACFMIGSALRAAATSLPEFVGSGVGAYFCKVDTTCNSLECAVTSICRIELPGVFRFLPDTATVKVSDP
jgi:hypothetical protein